MINLIITVFGGLMIIAGFYAMSFGFSTPPNIFLFFTGLCLAVLGLFLVIIFSSGIELPQRTPSSTPKGVARPETIIKKRPTPVKVEKKISKADKRREKIETIEKIKPRPRIRKPKKIERADLTAEATEDKIPPEIRGTIGAKEIKPKKKAGIGATTDLPPDLESKSAKLKEPVEKPLKTEPGEGGADKAESVVEEKPVEVEKVEPEVKGVEEVKSEAGEEAVKAKPEVEVEKIKQEIKEEEAKAKSVAEEKPAVVEKAEPKAEAGKFGLVKKLIPRIRREDKDKKAKPIKKAEEAAPAETKEGIKIEPVKAEEPSVTEKPPIIKSSQIEKLKKDQESIAEDEYVKKRLSRLKESYIQNAQDIESIIDERLDSFKGTLGKLKSESREPGIIWSFDAGDVQEAMTDIISKANDRLLVMYPWIRNIDVSILKKFMDTESRIIIQEASLDDDASVELLKLLMDKEVVIRTMPHVHTIAIVSDDTNGLIISTDPIYESYEVGVIYKDQKSIEEIENLFEDAWEISQEVDLGIGK